MLNSVKIREVLDALERFAPLPLQEGYDNAGLQLGLTETEVSGALLCLDVTEQTVDEAISNGCNLIVSHHPLLFRGLKCISDRNYVQRTVMKALQNNVAVISMHTNIDNAMGGVNFKMAEKLGLLDVHFMEPKIVAGVECGSGVIGMLPNPMTASEFLQFTKQIFTAPCIKANAMLNRNISKVALCGGSGAFLVDDAVRCGADAFITGEMGYHEMFGYEQQIQLAVIGHYNSEQYTKEIFNNIIGEECPGVRTVMSVINTDPAIYL